VNCFAGLAWCEAVMSYNGSNMATPRSHRTFFLCAVNLHSLAVLFFLSSYSSLGASQSVRFTCFPVLVFAVSSELLCKFDAAWCGVPIGQWRCHGADAAAPTLTFPVIEVSSVVLQYPNARLLRRRNDCDTGIILLLCPRKPSEKETSKHGEEDTLSQKVVEAVTQVPCVH
jgi:hypothetical protein